MPTDRDREIGKRYNWLLLQGGEYAEELFIACAAAAREEGRRAAIEECAKIADDCDYMVGRILAAAIAAKMRNLTAAVLVSD